MHSLSRLPVRAKVVVVVVVAAVAPEMEVALVVHGVVGRWQQVIVCARVDVYR